MDNHPTRFPTPVASAAAGVHLQPALCTAMRPARSEPVAGLDQLPPLRRLRLGSALTGLMLASYLATICGLAVFFCGVFLTTQNVIRSAPEEPPAPRFAQATAWASSAPSRDHLDREFSRYRQQVDARRSW